MKKRKILNRQSDDDVFTKRFDPEISVGLTKEQIEYREENGEVNKVQNATEKTYFQIVINNLFTFFNILMFSIAAVMIAVLGFDIILNLSFLLVLIANISIGTIQECKSKKAISKLKLLSANKIKVIRCGKEVEILQEEILLDDLIVLKSGDQIPVDCIIKTEATVEINESMLTGESKAVKKAFGENLYAGSFIISGKCIVRADKIGNDTYIASVESKAKNFKKPSSQLTLAISKIIKLLASIAIPLAVIVFWNNMLGSDFKNAVLFAGTTITYMIPCGLMLLTSVALMAGVVKLAQKNTLTQDLYSVESLARVDTLCLDKTGTLTDGSMTIDDTILFTHENVDNIISSYIGAFEEHNQTATAILNKYGNKQYFKPIKVINFSSERKYSAVEFEEEGIYALGAPEYLSDNEELIARSKEYAANGLRVLLMIHINGELKDGDDKLPKQRHKDMIAMFVIRDNIRPEVNKTLEWFRENDVDVRVISGDNVTTVSYIAKQAGIENWDKTLDMSTVNEYTENIESLVMNTTVFGRVTPEQKAWIIDILKKHGRTPAMTGDGVNDIIALKKADCSIALANGAPATKNIANLVLLDSNFNNMKDAVLEGRRVVNNVQRSSVLYIMKDFLWMFITLLPLLIGTNHIIEPVVMTIVNVIVCGIGSIFIAFEPDKERIKGSFLKTVMGKSISAGFYMFLPAFFVYIYAFIRTNLNIVEVDAIVQSFIPVISICVTIAGFVVFWNMCRPFTNFRRTLYIALLGVVVLLLTMIPELYLMNGTELIHELRIIYENDPVAIVNGLLTNIFSFSIYREFSEANWIFIISFAIVSFALYRVTEYLILKKMKTVNKLTDMMTMDLEDK